MLVSNPGGFFYDQHIGVFINQRQALRAASDGGGPSRRPGIAQCNDILGRDRLLERLWPPRH